MTSERKSESGKPGVSIGIFAWNEERALAATLPYLFQQTLFVELRRRAWKCQVVCLANGCTDRTPLVAQEIFERQKHQRPDWFSAEVANLAARGKINAWNQFVHELATRGAEYLFMMDADIVIHQPETLWNMLLALEHDSTASISVDRPDKHIFSKAHPTVLDRLSLAASHMTHAAEAQLCGQLYCIRETVARNIYLPKDLAACEDGFIKTLACTNFLTEAIRPERIRLAERAAHTFEAYTSPRAILKNQKRQIIGQTIVHILIDHDLKHLPLAQRRRLAETIKTRETEDPAWLKRRIHDHLQRTRYCWNLYPQLVSQRFRRLAKLSPLRKMACLPAAAAGAALAFVASFMAYRSLKAGCTDYWPKPQRPRLESLSPHSGVAPGLNSKFQTRHQKKIQRPEDIRPSTRPKGRFRQSLLWVFYRFRNSGFRFRLWKRHPASQGVRPVFTPLAKTQE